MNGEILYAFLMGTGWFFLIGWLFALLVAYVKAFREEHLTGAGPKAGLTASSEPANFRPARVRNS
jgi:hypothetical protein